MAPVSRLTFALGLWIAAASTALAASPPEVEQLPCLPLEGNAAVRATVPDAAGGVEVRLYFRRLNPRGAFYYDRMIAAGDGGWWSVLPRPEDRVQRPLDDDWWEVLRQRDWMRPPERDRAWLEGWLGERAQEAAEYYVATYAPGGGQLERSDVRLVAVRPADECRQELDAREAGWADNLTVGETTELQAGRQLFHWLCDGVVTRISARGILRADDYCRPCVVGDARRRTSDELTPAP